MGHLAPGSWLTYIPNISLLQHQANNYNQSTSNYIKERVSIIYIYIFYYNNTLQTVAPTIDSTAKSDPYLHKKKHQNYHQSRSKLEVPKPPNLNKTEWSIAPTVKWSIYILGKPSKEKNGNILVFYQYWGGEYPPTNIFPVFS